MEMIFFGDYGLLTMTPKYLLLVLFPVMVFLEIFGQLLPKIPYLQKTSPLINQIFYQFIGLGCTTVAIVSLEYIKDNSMRSRMLWILIMLMPCSAQLTLIAAFASMVSLQVFFVYLLFCLISMSIIYFIVSRVYPLNDGLIKISDAPGPFNPLFCIKRAAKSVGKTALPFCAGSVIISIAAYSGMLEEVGNLLSPFLESFLHLPKESASLLVLNVLKRDFGAASLLALTESGAFDAIQLVVVLMMMTFTVPCFNSTILLIKQERLPKAIIFWLGSLSLSILIGKIVSVILLVCFV